MNGHETYETLAAVYAVGALDGGDLAQLEAHLAEGCDRCTVALREAREVLAGLALADTPAVPRPTSRPACSRGSGPRAARARARPAPAG